MATQVEKAIAKGKSLLGSHAYDNYCQKFVRVCYEAAGITGSAASAREACNKWKQSSSNTNIPTGAAVYFFNSSDGHVGLYIGNGQMIHAWGSQGVIISDINICSNYQGWGWQGGQKPEGAGQTTASSSSGSSSSITKTYLGKFTTTAYCACVECCGKTDGITASGKKAQANHTIATDTSVIPLGSKVMIGNTTYYAEDTGGAIKGNRIDIFFNTHQEALNYGRQLVDVYLVNGTGDSSSDDSSDSSDTDKVDLCSTSVISTVNVGGTLNESTYLNISGNSDNLYELHIINNGVDYQPILVGDVTWTTEWKDTASKFEFTVLKDNALNIQEGDVVAFMMNGKGIFYGYLFEKSRGKGITINCVAYDQLRYLKNKDTYCYKEKTLTDVVTMIAMDYRLKVDKSKMTDTEYLIPGRVEDNQTLFDIIKNARDLTEQATGNMYIVFDDFGLLSVKSIGALKTDYLIDDETAEDFSYKSSIDQDVYNQIQFYRDDDTTGNRAKYIYQNADLINQWGVLQLTVKLENGDEPSSFGNTVLNLYAQKKRELEVKDCLGDTRLRAGASVFVNLNLGDVIYKNCQVIITKAIHKFGPKYSCDLTLLGGTPYVG